MLQSAHTGDSGRVPSSTLGSTFTSAANEHAGMDRDDIFLQSTDPPTQIANFVVTHMIAVVIEQQEATPRPHQRAKISTSIPIMSEIASGDFGSGSSKLRFVFNRISARLYSMGKLGSCMYKH
eukprot:IDg8625t1